MRKFKKGDRIVCVKQTPGWVNPPIGATGTVLEDSMPYVSVMIRWDDELPQKGHSCDGRCEDGRGWMLMAHDIDLAPEPFDLGECSCPSESSIMSLLLA